MPLNYVQNGIFIDLDLPEILKLAVDKFTKEIQIKW